MKEQLSHINRLNVVTSVDRVSLRQCHDSEIRFADTLLFRDYSDFNQRREQERMIHGSIELTSYDKLPTSYYEYEDNPRHWARNTQVIQLIENLYEASSSQDERFVVAEIGAGVGKFGKKLSSALESVQESNPEKSPFMYVPSDLASSGLEAMRENGFAPIAASATALPYAAGSCDVLYAGELIEHLSFPMFIQFMSEAQRVLKDNGTFIVTTPNFDSLPSREDKKLGLLPYVFDEHRDPYAAEHLLPFTSQSLEEILNRFAFDVTSVSTNQITWKIENGMPSEFTIYENAEDINAPDKGDTLIVSAKKRNLVPTT